MTADQSSNPPIDARTRCYATPRDTLLAMLDAAAAGPRCVPLVLLSAAQPARAGSGKKPVVAQWTALSPAALLAATREALLASTAPHNLGLRLDGLVVLDRDRRNDAQQQQAEAEARWQRETARARAVGAPIVATGGGGEHIYYRLPDHAPRVAARYLRAADGSELGGIEVKSGQTTQVVVPPSWHADGRAYAVAHPDGASAVDLVRLLAANQVPLAPADLLAELLPPRGGGGGGGKRPRGASAEPAQLQIDFDDAGALDEGRAAFRARALRLYPPDGLPARGARNDALYRLALLAREYGAPADPDAIESWLADLPAYAALRAEEADKCRATIRSACAREGVERGRRHPRRRAAEDPPGLDRLPPAVAEALPRNQRGELRDSPAALQAIVDHDPLLRACFRRELFAAQASRQWLWRRPDQAAVAGLEAVPWAPFDWQADRLRVAAFLAEQFGLEPAQAQLDQAVRQLFSAAVASRGRELAEAVRQRAAQRFETELGRDPTRAGAEIGEAFLALARALCVADDELARAAGSLRRHLQASLARIALLPDHTPIKHDYCLVLRGAQGARKTTAIARLSLFWPDEAYRSCAALQARSLARREDVDHMNGYQFVVFDELQAILDRATEHAAKSFVSDEVHAVNVKYGPVVVEPRRFVLWGTTNADDFLRDQTGNRRFWVVTTSATVHRPIDLALLDALRQRVWEAAALADLVGLPTYPTAAEEAELARAAEYFVDQSAALAQVEEWLAGLSDGQLADYRENGVTVAALAATLLGGDQVRAMDATVQRHVARALRALGWAKRRQQGHQQRAWRWYPPA